MHLWAIYELLTWLVSSLVVRLIFVLLIIISKWILFKKAGEKWRKSIIPIYNEYTLFKIWWHKKRFLRIFLPPAYLFAKIAIFFDISKKFWKWSLFACWLTYFPAIFYPILARWKAKYDNSQKMSRTLLQRFFAWIMWIIVWFIGALIFALFHPWLNKKVDEFRLNIQIPIMKICADFLIDDRAENYLWLIDEHEFMYNDEDMISWKELKPYISKLKRWDIIFTEWDKYISSIMIPWKWKHAIIYLGNWKILDATSKWITIWVLQDLDNLSRGSLLKSIIVFRPNLTKELKEKFIQFALNQIGKAYDFDYNNKNKYHIRINIYLKNCNFTRRCC